MADSLVLTGVKDVKNNAGTEMQLIRPKRGGDTHQLKEWWKTGANKCYVSCTVFNVTTTDGTVKLALDTNKSTNIRIDHDGFFNFAFYGINEVRRAALFTENYELIEHYVFPSISGGRIMTVTPAVAGSRPSGSGSVGATTIGTVTITGNTSPSDGDTETYTVSKTGDASPSYVLTSSEAGDVISGLDVTFNGSGARTLTATATDAAANDSPATGTLAINAAVLFTTRVANADLSVAVTVADTGNGNKYQINGVEQDSISATPGATIHFDLSDASLSGHPFAIYTDSSKTTTVTVGIETDETGNDLLFTPPIAGTFSYQCTQHSNMGGTITIN